MATILQYMMTVVAIAFVVAFILKVMECKRLEKQLQELTSQYNSRLTQLLTYQTLSENGLESIH